MSIPLVHVTRGPLVESLHSGDIAVADPTGRLIAWAGDPERLVFLRSTAKPIQALQVLRSGAADRFQFTDAEVALMCASHYGEDIHRETAAAILAKAGLDESYLRCGATPSISAEIALAWAATGQPLTPLHSDCSGKHAGMLAICVHRGWPLETYTEPEHPLQVENRRLLALLGGIQSADVILGTDGCTVPVFGMSLRAMARAYATLANPERLDHDVATACHRITRAMTAHPEMIAGTKGWCTELIRGGGGRWVAKLGAEGGYGVGLLERGLGIALKFDDGAYRGIPPVILQVLENLGCLTEVDQVTFAPRRRPEVLDDGGSVVGSLKTVFSLSQPPASLADLPTPCLLLDATKLERNLARLRDRMANQGVALRPHVKTAKCLEVVRRAGGTGITVSTLAEVEFFLGHGYRDMIYAVGLAPSKLARVADLRRRGADLAVILDSVAAAQALVEAQGRFHQDFPALIEIDCDGRRAGVPPGSPLLLEIGRTLGPSLRGVLTHAGGSYACQSGEAIRAMAERERIAVVTSAETLRRAGLPCPVVSLGSTPTATLGTSFEGVTEVRAGVYMFCDLVMAGLGVCTVDDIALSVLATVIGHTKDRIVTDAGWMALSRDRGAAWGHGLVCDLEGRALDLLALETNQEHSLLGRRDGGPPDARLPLGTRLRILPHHACATAAQHDRYHVIDSECRITGEWPRFGGW
jgi:L-asparaginase II/D-serine deaminase-like pyridoxal phosphate-dependent protein